MNEKPKRRWLSFRFRTMLLLWLAVCVLLGTVGVAVWRGRQETRAVLSIQELGGRVWYDYQLAELGDESALRRAERYKASAESPVPKWIADLLGHDCFVHIAVVDWSGVTDTRFLPQQRGAHRPITDDDLLLLESLRELRELDLTFQLVTDEGLAKLGFLRRLKRLVLQGTDISDAGLAELARLRSLRSINLYNTRVTEQGVREFRQRHPQCHVAWNGDLWYHQR